MKKAIEYIKNNKLQVCLLSILTLCCIWLCSLLIGKLMYIPKQILMLQILPIVLITISTFTQIILCVKNKISKQQILMFFIVVLVLLYPQVVHFFYFLTVGIATFDIWLLVLLFLLIASAPVIYTYTSKVENSVEISGKTTIAVSTLGIAVVVLEILFLSILNQQKKIELGHYYTFMMIEFFVVSLLVIMYAYIYREQRTISHVITS